MSKGFKGFLIGLVVIVAGFLLVTTGFCIHNKTNPVEEWKSWLPQETVEETVEKEETDDTLHDWGEEITPVEVEQE